MKTLARISFLEPFLLAGILLLFWTGLAFGQEKKLLVNGVLLRSGTEPEWEEFVPYKAHYGDFLISSNSMPTGPVTLLLRHRDVKHSWAVLLNGKKIGQMEPHDRDIWTALEFQVLDPSETMVLKITPPREADDVLLEEIQVHPDFINKLLSAEIHLEIRDENNVLTPGRVTIVDSKNARVPVKLFDPASKNGPHPAGQAARPGVIYTSTGIAVFKLRPGDYKIYSGRGLEYSVFTEKVNVQAGKPLRLTAKIEREIFLTNWATIDPHTHTLTHSGHGDASTDERLAALAGEGLDFAVVTEHNKQINYAPPSGSEIGRTRLITGNEVTTAFGHFNLFPVQTNGHLPDPQATNWNDLALEFEKSTDGIRILNHPRDLHKGFRPFGTNHFNPVTGKLLSVSSPIFNAVEIMNSGSIQSDPMQLVYDWFALLNRGHRLTAIGASDSHDVDRYIVGQGRTYVRVEDRNAVSVDEIVSQIKQGRASVSMGLILDLEINGQFRSGDTVSNAGAGVEARIRVLGPSWSASPEIRLYANGELAASRGLNPARISLAKGILDDSRVSLARNTQDYWLVALATAPGSENPFWPLVRPYQPQSKKIESRYYAVSNPVYIDADNDGRFSSASEYAEKLWKDHSNHPAKLFAMAARYDSAVWSQLGGLIREEDWNRDLFQSEFRKAAPDLRSAIMRAREYPVH